MTLYRNSKYDNYTAGGLVSSNPCEVRISEKEIVVSYHEEGVGQVVYEGREVEKGHYSLSTKTKNGKATLHRIPDENTLEGSWIQEGEQGMWIIDLEE